MTYRGEQYRYKGHVISLLKDIGTLYRKLPLLPQDLDVIILRPRNQTDQPHMKRQFQKEFRVRRAAVQTWLEYLHEHHAGYRDIAIDEQSLSQLPSDGNIAADLITEQIDETTIEQFVQEVEGDDEFGWEGAAIPNFIAQQREADFLHNRLQGRRQQSPGPVPLQLTAQHGIGIPEMRSTPINDFGMRQPLLSLAFPTLSPQGKGDYTEPRQRKI